MASAPNGHPFGKCGVDNWEIEHVDHFAVKESGVTSSCGKEFCHLCEGAFAEYHTVEKGVDDIANCTAENGGETHKNSGWGITALEEFPDVYYDGYGKYHSEYGEDEFANVASELHSEGHARIFNKKYLEPTTKYMDALTNGHIGLNQDFDNLVNNQKKDYKEGYLETSRNFHLRYLFISFLPSTLSVAWGTSLSLSLGISLPVTRQIP